MDPFALGLTGALVPILLVLLGRGAAARVEPGQLRYSRLLRWFSVLLGLLPPLAILTIIQFLQKRPLRSDEHLPVLLMTLGFPALMLPVMIEFLRVQHHFDDAGLMFQSPWSRYRWVAWGEVVSVRWRRGAKSLTLETRAGVKVHLSPWLAGLKPFADVALARLPPAVLTAHPEGRVVLLLMSAGVAAELMTSPLTPEHLLAARSRG